MIMSEKMFVVVGAFVFGYCLGYYSFEILKYKKRKEESHEFFANYNKKYGSQCRRSYEKTRRDQNCWRYFFGKDLSYEQNFLNAIIEKFGKELKDCEVSSYLNKKINGNFL